MKKNLLLKQQVKEKAMTKILIVEDELHIQRLIRIILEKQSYEVELASSGEECLQVLAEMESAPDLILLDILMPGIDGMQILRNLKADSKFTEVPVVMLTALSQENIVIEGIKLGATDYIRKPFHPDDLIERIRKFLP